MRIHHFLERLRRLLPGVWAGALWCIALLAAPALFSTLDLPTAGRAAGALFAREAPLSLGLGVILLWCERRRAAWPLDEGEGERRSATAASQFSVEMMFALGAVVCTVVGYYALQPQMAAARLGASPLSFGQWHAIAMSLFGLKAVLATGLAWRALRPAT